MVQQLCTHGAHRVSGSGTRLVFTEGCQHLQQALIKQHENTLEAALGSILVGDATLTAAGKAGGTSGM